MKDPYKYLLLARAGPGADLAGGAGPRLAASEGLWARPSRPVHNTLQENKMKNFENIQLLTLANTLVSLLSAFVLGSIVGFERQFRQRTAGLRTNALVAVGAAIFVDMAFRVGGADGGARVISYVVSGVGFLGAGAIMREAAASAG